MAGPREIHVGDVGTKYRVRTWDNGVDFDPTSASTKQIIFAMPGGVRLAKDAEGETGSGTETGRYYLTYTVAAAAGAAGADFHAMAGFMRMQGYVEYASGNKWSSNEIGIDDEGRKLKIWPNL